MARFNKPISELVKSLNEFTGRIDVTQFLTNIIEPINNHMEEPVMSTSTSTNDALVYDIYKGYKQLPNTPLFRARAMLVDLTDDFTTKHEVELIKAVRAIMTDTELKYEPKVILVGEFPGKVLQAVKKRGRVEVEEVATKDELNRTDSAYLFTPEAANELINKYPSLQQKLSSPLKVTEDNAPDIYKEGAYGWNSMNALDQRLDSLMHSIEKA